MNIVRQSMQGLFIALIAVALLWLTWLTSQAEDLFAAPESEHRICEYPIGWKPYTLQPEDDLASLTEATGYPLEEILASNCLPVDANLPVGDRIYLPIAILELINPACGPPEGWGYYLTSDSDSLQVIAEEFGVPVEQLRVANCFMEDSDFEAGMRIYAPASALVTATLAPSATLSTTLENGSAATATVEP
jgi:hypothetical protein